MLAAVYVFETRRPRESPRQMEADTDKQTVKTVRRIDTQTDTQRVTEGRAVMA